MQVGDLVKDNLYGRFGIITQITTNNGKIDYFSKYLVVYIDDGGDWPSWTKEKWMEAQYFKKIS